MATNMRAIDHPEPICLESILDYAEDNAKNDWEKQFVDSLRESFEEHGYEMFLSFRQRNRLESIAKRGW